MKDEVHWFVLYRPYLLSGTWVNGLEVLREMNKLEHVELLHLEGGEYRDKSSRPCLEDEIHEYFMRKREENPLMNVTVED